MPRDPFRPILPRRAPHAVMLTAALVAAPAARADSLETLANTLSNFTIPGFVQSFPTVGAASKVLDGILGILQLIPGLGGIASAIKQVMGKINDVAVVAGPIVQALNTAGTYLKTFVDGRNAIKNLFSPRDVNDVLSNVETLTKQVGGLKGLPPNFRKTFVDDPRAAVDAVRQAVDQRMSQLATNADQARRSGDATGYQRNLLQIEELTRMRARLRHLGESAAAAKNAEVVARRTQQSAEAAARASLGMAGSLMGAETEVQGLKLLGSLGVQQLNASATGFDALSNQLSTISKQMTVTNEQNDQLLATFQQEARERAARDAMLIDEDRERREAELKAMRSASRNLSDGIGQTLNPRAERQSDYRSLMQGGAR